MIGHVLVDFVLARHLHSLGFAPTVSTDEGELARAVYRYQEFHGLETDSWCGPETRESILAPRFCGHPDVMPLQLAASLCRWPQKRITWTITGKLPGFLKESLISAYTLAWDFWRDVCDITPAFADEDPAANVLMGTGAIDGGGSTLAWSELPCSAGVRQLKQLYDTGETWVNSATPQQTQIDLVRVACHEIGHVLGIPHIATGNLLAPFYSQQIRQPQAGDISEAVQRYGARPKLPPTPAAEEYVVTFQQPVSKIIVRRAV